MNEDQQMSLQAGLDQMGAVLRDFAPQVAAYYKALLASGIPAGAAKDLAVQFQAIFLAVAFGGKGQP